MLRYVEKIIVPFFKNKQASLHLNKEHPALCIFDHFHGQMTTEFKSILSKLNIVYVTVPANCTDKLQPLDVAVNKLIKDEIRSRFQSWYADEVREQLQIQLVHEVTVDVSASVVKSRSLGWFASSWQSLAAGPTLAINGFKKAGIYDAVTEVSNEL